MSKSRGLDRSLDVTRARVVGSPHSACSTQDACGSLGTLPLSHLRPLILISTHCHLYIHSGPIRTLLFLRGSAEMSLIGWTTNTVPSCHWKKFSLPLKFQSISLALLSGH